MRKSNPVSLTVMVAFDNGRVLQESVKFSPTANVAVAIDQNYIASATIEPTPAPVGDDIKEDRRREYNRNEPVSPDQRDTGNTEPDQLTDPLDPDDDIYTLIHKGQDEPSENPPVAK